MKLLILLLMDKDAKDLIESGMVIAVLAFWWWLDYKATSKNKKD